jgi:hypothetical protein
MKSNVLLIAALISLSASINAVAKEEDPRSARLAVVPVKGSEVFKVIYKNESSARVRLNLYNASSELVFSEIISTTDGFIRPLNFAGLRAGEYTLEIIEGSKKKVEKISFAPLRQVSEKAVVAKKNVHVSKVNGEGKFLVAIASSAVDERVTLKIVDRHENVIYSETRSLTGDFAQVYRVKDAAGVRFEIYDASGLTKVSRF